jgi:hypothetical protein
LELLLAEPKLVEQAKEAIAVEEIEHPGLRRLYQEMTALWEAGEIPNVDLLRARLIEHPRLAEYIMRLEAAGSMNLNHGAWLADLIKVFAERHWASQKTELRSQLVTTPTDGPVPVELLRQIQQRV